MSILVKKNEDSEIFGGTFKRVAQNSGSFCTGDGLRDTGKSVGGIDEGRPNARGTDLDQEGGRAAVAATVTERFGSEGSGKASYYGRAPGGERHLTDSGPKRYTEEICEEDAVFGDGA